MSNQRILCAAHELVASSTALIGCLFEYTDIIWVVTLLAYLAKDQVFALYYLITCLFHEIKIGKSQSSLGYSRIRIVLWKNLDIH